jgi:hypothetical protein
MPGLIGITAKKESFYTNFLFRRYTLTPPTPRTQGGSKKVSVASIEEIGITQADSDRKPLLTDIA